MPALQLVPQAAPAGADRPRTSATVRRPAQDVAARLAGPGGLDLAVEIVHDLRSPLTAIVMLAEQLGSGRSGAVTALQQRQLRLIYASALGLASLTSDVLELARGGDQLVEPGRTPFSVSEMFASVGDMVRPIAEEKGLEVRFACPPAGERLGRPLALSRVLLNLTTNALKFTDAGYVLITARVTGVTAMEFSVRDTGSGMQACAEADPYQPFRRIGGGTGRSRHRFDGTGLGLAMCRKLVEPMGAHLQFESKPGWGTRFYFELDLPPAGRP